MQSSDSHSLRPLPSRIRRGRSGRFRAFLRSLALFALLACLACVAPVRAEKVSIAVATNFAETLRELVTEFEAHHPHTVQISTGSTGKLYAQIAHGAPFDLFFAADTLRPKLLEEAGLALPGSRKPYAVGRLALWVPSRSSLENPEDWLRSATFRHLAMAHPRLAPYGRAARETLKTLKLWEPLKDRVVLGESVGQAYQFVGSQSAEAGFVALAQLRQRGSVPRGAHWVVPEALHPPLTQTRVQLKQTEAADQFLAFLSSQPAQAILTQYGYLLPKDTHEAPSPTRFPAQDLLTQEDWKAFRLTMKLALVTTTLLLLLGTPLAWWLARTSSRARILVEAMVSLPLVLPPTVLGFYLLLFMGPHGPLGKLMWATGSTPLVFRFEGLVLGSLLYSLPFVVQPLQSSFEAIDERLLEAASTLGASPLDRFFTVVLPLSRSGFITALVLGFAHTLGEFGVVLMVGGNLPGETKVLSIAIYDHVETLQYARAHTLAGGMLVLSFVLLMIVYTTNRNLKLVRR